MTEIPSVRTPTPLPEGVSPATVAVRGGLLRSGFDETAEAMYLTSGYVYESAAEAEKAFTGEIDRYVYSRYGNPTVTMFEERLRLIEGAPAAFATASGMAAVFTSLYAMMRLRVFVHTVGMSSNLARKPTTSTPSKLLCVERSLRQKSQP